MTRVPPFSALLAARSRRGTCVHFDIGADWQQGRTAFGGIVSAVAAQAMRDVAGAAWPADVTLRALQSSFVAVVEPGPLEVEVEVLRQGRNVCQVLSHVRQRGSVCAVLMGVYSAGRASALAVRRPARPPARAEADALPSQPYLEGLMPAFLQHVEMRWADGTRPFSGTPGYRSSIHLRLLDDDAGALPGELLTVLLGDTPPTPVIGELKQVVPSSSVSWALELRPVAAGLAGWWRADSESLVVDEGYVNHRCELWAPDGSLAALGTQVVTVFG